MGKNIKLHHKANWSQINKNIRNKITQPTPNHKSSCEQINDYVINIATAIRETIDQEVPTKTIKEQNTGLPPLIRNMIKDKKHLLKKIQQTGIKWYKTQYNNHNREIKKLIKEENQKQWEKTCNDLELKDNQNTSWHTLKSIMGTKNKKTNCPTLLIKDEEGNIIKKAETTEDKIETFTNAISTLFTPDDKPEFDENYKTKVDNTIKK